MVVEIDFPRGGEPERIGPKKRRHIIFGEKKGNKNSGDSSKAKDNEGVPVKETDEYEAVFRQNLTLELLAPGVRGLGIVKQINDIDVILECADGILVKLPGNCISKTFTNSLQTTEKTLEDIFVVGQAIAFKVTKSFTLRANHRKSKPEVTTCPYAVNSHLLSSNLLAGLVLNGIVTSVEEKGAVLDFGLSSKVTGFVNASELPAYLAADQLCVGQVLMVRVKTTPTLASRVVAVSAVPEMLAFDHERLNLNQLMPGTVLLAQLEKVTRSGIFVAFSNDVKGFVRNSYLPPRFRIDPSQVTSAKALKLCVLACQQNSPLLILTGNTDVVAISKVEKRALPEQFQIGQKVSCKVYELDKNKNVYFTLEEDENGKLPTIVAKAWRNQIDEPEKNLPKFTVGSEHVCRVIGYHAMERMILVSTKAEVLKQKIVSVDEAKPGDKYTVTIIAIKPNGLRVQLFDDIQGHIPAMHVKNKMTKNWEKGFRTGQSISCRVLFKDTTKNNLILTAKPMMVDSKERIISELSESLVGEVAVGSVIKALDSGSLLVGFYNRVVGLLEASNAAKIANVYAGMPLKIRVRKVNVEGNHMLLDFGDDSLDNVVSATLKKPVPVEDKPKEKKKVLKPAKPFLIYTAKVVGGWPYGGTSALTSAELLLNGGTIGRLHASELDLSKCTKGSKPMDEFLDRNKGKMVNVKVICVGNRRSISKEGKNTLMKQFETSRFVECTLNPEKITEVRRKLNLINFKTEFRYGEIVPTFFALDLCGNVTRNGEINPLFKAIIGQTEVEGLEYGSLISGKVVGVNKTTRAKCVLIGDESEKHVSKEGPEFGSPISGKVNKTTRTKRTLIGDESEKHVKKEDDERDERPRKRKRTDSVKSEIEDDLHEFDASALTGEGAVDKVDTEGKSETNYEKVKAIAEQTLKVTNFKDDDELFHVWSVYLNLEVAYGTEESLRAVFERACGATDSLKIHKYLIKALKKHSKLEEATEICESMLKKFRHDDLEVWYLYGAHLMEMGEMEKSRNLLQRALQSLKKKNHVAIITRFAQLENRFGDAQRARTMLEKVTYYMENSAQIGNIQKFF